MQDLSVIARIIATIGLLIVLYYAASSYLAFWIGTHSLRSFSVSSIRRAFLMPMLILVFALGIGRYFSNSFSLVLKHVIQVIIYFVFFWAFVALAADLVEFVLRSLHTKLSGKRFMWYAVPATSFALALNLFLFPPRFLSPPQNDNKVKIITPQSVIELEDRFVRNTAGITSPIRLIPFSKCVNIFNPECRIRAKLVFRYGTIVKSVIGKESFLYLAWWRGGPGLKVRFAKLSSLDLDKGTSKSLDDAGASPLFSPNSKMLAYDKYLGGEDSFYGNLPVPKSDVWVVEIPEGNKHALTTDGKTKILRWLNDKEILAANVEFNGDSDEEYVGDWDSWKKTGYIKIDIVSGAITRLAFEPEKPESRNSIKIIPFPAPPMDTTHFDLVYGTRTVLRIPAINTESEWTWAPEILWISDKQFLTVRFEPNSDEKPPFSLHEQRGRFDLVKVDCDTMESVVVHKDIDELPDLTLSPDKKMITWKIAGSSAATSKGLILADIKFDQKRNIGEDLGLKSDPLKVVWAADSNSLFLEFYPTGYIYQVGIE